LEPTHSADSGKPTGRITIVQKRIQALEAAISATIKTEDVNTNEVLDQRGYTATEPQIAVVLNTIEASTPATTDLEEKSTEVLEPIEPEFDTP